MSARAHRRDEWPPPLRAYLPGVIVILGLIAIAYFSFAQRLPWSSPYRVQIVFDSSSGLRQNSPVRVAGVDVGRVKEIGRGPGHTTAVTVEIDDDGRPVHADAIARIRPRVFLEGGYAIELSPGSPRAPELADGGTIPIGQTTRPVQFHDFLTVFDTPARESMQRTLDTFARGLASGGAQGLRTLAPQLRPLLRDTAIVAEASAGTERDDLARLVTATERVVTALDEDPAKTGALVDRMADVARTFDARGSELAATLRELDAITGELPAATAALDAALPALERSAVLLSDGLEVAPAAFREVATEVRKLGRLVHPSRRAQTIAGLQTAFVDLPDMVGELARVFPSGKGVSDCLRTHVIPMFSSVAPDGDLSSGRPIWQDFAHSLVGLASASQNFDGNGHALRYQFGIGAQSFSLTSIPGIGPALATAPSTLQSRPLPRPDGSPPPYRTDVPCSTQPPVRLETPAGPAGLSPAPGARRVEPLSDGELRRALRPRALERLLGRMP